MGAYLLVIGERAALAWILRESRMAFPATRRREVETLQPGDRLLLTSTRGCFHNPTRDATRVIGSARASSPVEVLDPPVSVAGRDFPRGCTIEIESLAPYLQGVSVADLVDRLDAFAGSNAWGMLLRRPLLTLSLRDQRLLESRLRPLADDPRVTIPGYLHSIHPVLPNSRRAQTA